MARPIAATPTLEGSEAQRVLDDIENVCSPDEAQRRIDWAKQERARMMSRTRAKHEAREADARALADGSTSREELARKNVFLSAERFEVDLDRATPLK